MLCAMNDSHVFTACSSAYAQLGDRHLTFKTKKIYIYFLLFKLPTLRLTIAFSELFSRRNYLLISIISRDINILKVLIFVSHIGQVNTATIFKALLIQEN